MYHGELAMTSGGPAFVNQPALAEEAEIIETRFGSVRISRDRAITFPNGMLGMPDRVQYCFANFPSAKMERFKLLQSLDDPSLSFITLPIELDNSIIERTDLETAARDMDIPIDALACLLIVTVNRDTGTAQLSVNARAPIFVHTAKRVAGQYVFANSKYNIRHALTL